MSIKEELKIEFVNWLCSTNTDGKKRYGLVDPAEGGHIDGLTTNGTLRSNTGGILAGSSVDDGVDQNLHIQVSYSEANARPTHLNGVLVGEEVNDFECVCNNANGHKLLAIVATLHHQAVSKMPVLKMSSRPLQDVRTCQPIARRWASAPS